MNLSHAHKKSFWDLSSNLPLSLFIFLFPFPSRPV